MRTYISLARTLDLTRAIAAILLLIIAIPILAAADHETHRVKSGETLNQILVAHGFSEEPQRLWSYVEQVLELNPDAFVYDNPDYIEPGMTLKLPKSPAPKTVPVTQPVAEIQILNISAGRVHLDKGSYQILREKQTLTFKESASVYPGDRIRTAGASVVRIQLRDQSVYVLGSNSEFEIEDFSFAKNPSNNPKAGFIARFKLWFGAVSAKSGIVGRQNRDSYRLNTPLATVGIRGTDYTVRFCDNDQCGNYPGVSTAVTNGEVSFENKAGTTPLGKEEFVHAKTEDEKPQVTAIPEGFLDLNTDLNQVEDVRPWWQQAFDYSRSLLSNSP